MNSWIAKFKKNKIGMGALSLVLLCAFLGLYAPFFASSKPFVVHWGNQWYFPFFRYLFFMGFYTKAIDLFYNILMFLLPVALVGTWLLSRYKKNVVYYLLACGALQISLFLWVLSGNVKDPKSDYILVQKREQSVMRRDFKQQDPLTASFHLNPTWAFELAHMNSYQKLDIVVKELIYKKQHDHLLPYIQPFEEAMQMIFPTKWNTTHQYEQEQITHLEKKLALELASYEEAKSAYSKLLLQYQPLSHAFILAKKSLEEGKLVPYESFLEPSLSIRSSLESARLKIEDYLQLQAKLQFLKEKRLWLLSEEKQISFILFPPLRPFHWEENAGGHSQANKYLPWYEVTRSNRKDLAASLLFGLRISFVVGITAVTLALFIGATLGMISGYFAGKFDLVICRWIEVWEAMPTFFMLLLIVAVTQSKSIFLVITVIGLFGWTGFTRFMRAEVLKQRNLNYALAGKALGYSHRTLMWREILPNAIAPILTLLPFSMMVAISSEAALSFLGLGEEGSSSLGVLMDEGRHAFPGESYLLWPAAIVLTTLLIAMALVGDALRDALDPKSN